MPRGKNYVNNNRGVFLQAPKKKGTAMEACFFGAGCTRPGCIYRHDHVAAGNDNPQSEEPCMAYLAGYCSFNARSCRKRHPPPAEADRLRQKYSQIRCRYGSQCQTQGCLYRHEALSEPVNLAWTVSPTTTSSSALLQVSPAPPSAPLILAPNPPPMPVVPGTSWRPTPPSQPPRPLATPPSQLPLPPQSRAPATARPAPPSHPPMPPSFPSQSSTVVATTTSITSTSTLRPPVPNTTGSSSSFNINAKAFVPGGGFG